MCCSLTKAIFFASNPRWTRALKNASGRSFTFSMLEFCSKTCSGTSACLLPKIIWVLFFKFIANQGSLESWHPWLPSLMCIKKPRSVLYYFCSPSGLLKFSWKSGRKWDFKGTKWILISVYIPEIHLIFVQNLLIINSTSTITPGRWKIEKEIQSFNPNTYKYKFSLTNVSSCLLIFVQADMTMGLHSSDFIDILI